MVINLETEREELKKVKQDLELAEQEREDIQINLSVTSEKLQALLNKKDKEIEELKRSSADE